MFLHLVGVVIGAVIGYFLKSKLGTSPVATAIETEVTTIEGDIAKKL